MLTLSLWVNLKCIKESLTPVKIEYMYQKNCYNYFSINRMYFKKIMVLFKILTRFLVKILEIIQKEFVFLQEGLFGLDFHTESYRVFPHISHHQSNILYFNFELTYKLLFLYAKFLQFVFLKMIKTFI